MKNTATALNFELLASLPAITRAMDHAGTTLYLFADGTAALWDDHDVPDLLYSPRLALPQLEAFCQQHAERYQAFYDQHAAAIENGEKVPMSPWWGLPNASTTWGKPIEAFDAWQARVEPNGTCPETDQLLYLTAQLKEEGVALQDVRFNHPLLGLLNYLDEQQPRVRELLYAYLAYVVTGDTGPMQQTIAGQRLQPDLHPDYVAATACYGQPSAFKHA